MKRTTITLLIFNFLFFWLISIWQADRAIESSIINPIFNKPMVTLWKMPENLSKVTKLVDEYLIPSSNRYWLKYKPSEKYNQIVEKQLILLIKESYVWNEDFYKNLLKPDNYYNRSNNYLLEDVIKSIPKWYKNINISSIIYNKNTVTSSLLDSTFWVKYSDSTNYNSLINTIRRQIETFKRNSWYYPSFNELWEISVYRNRKEVKVSEIIGDFEYKIIKWSIITSFKRNIVLDNLRSKVRLSRLNSTIIQEINLDIIKLENNLNVLLARNLIKKYEWYYSNTSDRTYNDIKKSIESIYFWNNTFELKYKNITFTSKEAKAELEKVWVSEIEYKDYKKLIWDNKVENIPEVYKMIPDNSIFFHVSNPEFLFDLLEDNQNYDNSWVEILKKVRDLIIEKAGLESFDDIKKAIKHDFVIVLSDIDLVSPNILIILDKKDKWFLWVVTPWSNPKATITKWDKILIANSKELLDTYTELDEKDSIYNSDDFRYVWMKKKDVKKDIFFFAWDKFFEKLISFENYIKMKRKINDYYNLSELQSFVFAYEKISWNKVNNFDGLNKILQIEDVKLSDYELKNSILKSKRIWKIDDIKNIDEINYDLNKITREELESYKENILNYKEIWRWSLDPLWVIFTWTDKGFETDFFMTPIPEVKDNDLNLFKILFENIWTDKLDFMENKNLRIWTVGWILWFDTEKIKEKINNFSDKKETNRDLYYLSKEIEEFNNDVLWWKSIFDYFDWEIMLSIAWVEKSIFSSYNMEKLDAFLAIEFKSNLKAKEFIKIVRKKIASEFTRWWNSFEDKLTSSLIKPLSEDYNWELIYIIPEVNLYFIRPSFYYTVIGKYFYISLSKDSIKNTIDFYKEPWEVKQKFIDNSMSWNKTLFMFLDSDNLKSMLDELTSESSLTDLYLEIKTWDNLWEINLLKHKIWIYYSTLEYNNLLWKETRSLNEKYWILELKSRDNNIYLTIDKNKILIKDIELKKELLSAFDNLSTEYFTEKWWDITPLLKDKSFDEFFAIATFNMILNKTYRDSFFNNMTSFVDMSDNEIQLKFNSFSDNIKKGGTIDDTVDSIKETLWISTNDWKNNILYIIIWVLILVIVLWWAVVIKGKKKVGNKS